MKNKLINFFKFFVAVMASYLFASIAHTQFVLAGLINIGVNISISDRLSMTMSDIIGLAPGYGAVIFVALAVGFLLINAISKWVFPLPNFRYAIAGFAAMAVALLAMYPLLNVTLIAGAREPAGFFTQCVAGFFGGLVFMSMNKKPEQRRLFR